MRFADMPGPAPPAAARHPRLAAPALSRAAWFLGALALFLSTRPHAGIVQDAVLYVGRAVADGDPAGLGRDIIFAFDGQSRFSLFTAVADRLVARIGPDAASWWLGRVGLVAWFAAFTVFARQLAGGRRLWAILAIAALAPAMYGGDGGFRYAEPYAIPRPYAEAAVLAGLAALMVGRGRFAGQSLERFRLTPTRSPPPRGEELEVGGRQDPARRSLLAAPHPAATRPPSPRGGRQRPGMRVSSRAIVLGWVAAACLALAALVHPIMAAPGMAVAFAVLCARDRRWLLAVAAGIALLVASAALGMPIAARLFTTVDPAWSDAIHQTHVTYPSLWPAETWASIAVQAVTVALAARALDGPGREMLVAILAVAAAGVAAAILFGEGLSLLLVLQAQPWRTLWLLKVAAAASMPVAGLSLWRLGPPGRVALAALAFGWLSAETDAAPATLAAAAAAALAGTVGVRRPSLLTPLVARAAWLGFAAYALLWWWLRARFAHDLAATSPDSAAPLRAAWLMEVAKPALAVAVMAWLLGPAARIKPFLLMLRCRPKAGLEARTTVVRASRLAFSEHLSMRKRAVRMPGQTPGPNSEVEVISRVALAGMAGLALALAALASVDGRTPLVRRLDTWRSDPALVSLLPAQPGEVLWIRGGVMRPWVLAGRPSWISAVQGSSVLFSRDLATTWNDRMARLLAAKLGDASDRSPNLSMSERGDLAPAAADITAFCAAPDAPAAILAPLDGGFRVPDGIGFATYRVPEPEVGFTLADDGRPLWSESRDVAIIRCRGGS